MEEKGETGNSYQDLDQFHARYFNVCEADIIFCEALCPSCFHFDSLMCLFLLKLPNFNRFSLTTSDKEDINKLLKAFHLD